MSRRNRDKDRRRASRLYGLLKTLCEAVEADESAPSYADDPDAATLSHDKLLAATESATSELNADLRGPLRVVVALSKEEALSIIDVLNGQVVVDEEHLVTMTEGADRECFEDDIQDLKRLTERFNVTFVGVFNENPDGSIPLRSLGSPIIDENAKRDALRPR